MSLPCLIFVTIPCHKIIHISHPYISFNFSSCSQIVLYNSHVVPQSFASHSLAFPSCFPNGPKFSLCSQSSYVCFLFPIDSHVPNAMLVHSYKVSASIHVCKELWSPYLFNWEFPPHWDSLKSTIDRKLPIESMWALDFKESQYGGIPN
jgi:hypothetical protein